MVYCPIYKDINKKSGKGLTDKELRKINPSLYRMKKQMEKNAPKPPTPPKPPSFKR